VLQNAMLAFLACILYTFILSAFSFLQTLKFCFALWPQSLNRLKKERRLNAGYMSFYSFPIFLELFFRRLAQVSNKAFFIIGASLIFISSVYTTSQSFLC
jgi:hypothetical protein